VVARLCAVLVHRRLAAVAKDAGLRSIDGAVRLPSASNEAWKVGDVVVRISWSDDLERVLREVMVLQHLPASVPHPEVLGHGATGDRTWTLTRWVPGDVAIGTWRWMSSANRDRFAQQLADALVALHEWSPSAEVRELVERRRSATTVDDLIGQDVNPLPIDRALALVDEAKRAPHADAAVIDAVAGRLRELRAFDVGGGESTVIHGDLHLRNIVEVDSRLQTVLDFEWVRLGPPDLDLQAFLRAEAAAESAEVITRLAEHYPGIVAHPRIVERLWLYDLACTLRDVIVCPATTAPPNLRSHDPLRRLPLIVESPAYIERLLDR
jgi:aminoglycoside phosphotransferase (APT) family kinase protein